MKSMRLLSAILELKKYESILHMNEHSSSHIDATCRFCGNRQNNTSHIARDNFYGVPGEFKYLECAACKSLQLQNIPADLSPYYPSTYYSFEDNPEPYPKNLIQYRHYRNMGVEKHHEILDVGCGTGSFLLAMKRDGFTKLAGIDPFISKDIEYPGGLSISKQEISTLQGQYDLVMLHHSFEHIEDQGQALADLRKLIKPDHYVFLRMPVADSFAWKEYGVDWIQLDAPRHINIHTEKSLSLLAKEHGFELTQVEYDSNSFQFWGSEFYQKGLLYSEIDFVPGRDLSEEQLQEYNEKSKELNEIGQGDQACFYLRKLG